MGFWSAMVGAIIDDAVVVEVKEDSTSRTVITQDDKGHKIEHVKAKSAKSGGKGGIHNTRDRAWWEIFG